MSATDASGLLLPPSSHIEDEARTKSIDIASTNVGGRQEPERVRELRPLS